MTSLLRISLMYYSEYLYCFFSLFAHSPAQSSLRKDTQWESRAEQSEVQLGHLIYLWMCLFSAEHRHCPADFYHCAVTHRRPPLISALFRNGWGKLYKRVELLTINSNRLHDVDEGVKSRRFIILEGGKKIRRRRKIQVGRIPACADGQMWISAADCNLRAVANPVRGGWRRCWRQG